MGKQRALDGWCEPPSDVRITVLQDPADRPLWKRLPARRCIGIVRRPFVAVVVLVALGALVATSALSVHASASRSGNARAHERGPTGVAAAYGYPTRCLSVTISTIDPAFARADFNHASPCGRYAGYPTAIFHRVDRAWRAVVEAVSYPCPATGIPPAVQRELGVCPGTTRSRQP